MIWFTSDLHLAHRNIISIGGGRPFDSIGRMEAYIIDAINDRVSCADTLWVLGDFTMRGTPEKVAPYLERIACADVRLIRGNHDRLFRNAEGPYRRFSEVADYAELASPAGDRGRFVLSHYPMLDWDRMHHGSYMLHGHIHSRPAGGAGRPAGPRFASHEHGYPGYNDWNRANGIRRYDVGVDANGYAPVSMEQIVAFFEGMELACLGAREGEED